MPFSSVLKDWREVGGLKIPFSIDTQAGPITFTQKTSDVRWDQPMDEKMFEPPGGLGGDAGVKGRGTKPKHSKK
jgi:hypothetical protein